MSGVEIEDRGAVRHVILNRPQKRNAIDAALLAALDAALRAAADDATVRCVVLRGAGAVFSAGMDVAVLASLAGDDRELERMRAAALSTWNLCEEMPKPTIAQIHGACIGGAAELALACDIRTMASDARIAWAETSLGLLPDLGGCSRLPAIVGLGVAKELVMTARPIDGERAYAIGLANRVTSAAELDAATSTLADELLACAPLALAHAKRVLNAAARPGLAQTLELEGEAGRACAKSADFAEGVLALAQRRPPRFTGS